MVSLENGAYRLTSITDNPAGNLKLVFDLGSVDHPIFGKTGPLCGEIPLFHTRESMPISNYYELTEEQQTKLLKDNIAQFRPVLDNLDEEDLYKKTLGGILLASVSLPRVDVFSSAFDAGIGMSVMSFVIDDYTEDMELFQTDPSGSTRMIIDNFCIDWETFRSRSEEDEEAFLNKINALLPVSDAIKSWFVDFIKKSRKEFPNGVLPDGFKYVSIHANLCAGSVPLRYRADDPTPLSEDMHKVLRGYDAGGGPTVQCLYALRTTEIVPKKIRKSLMFKLLDTAVMDFSGFINDLLGIQKDINKDTPNENTILRSVLREGVPVEKAFYAALKRMQNLLSDIKILMQRLLEAFPDEKSLAHFVDVCKEGIDGQILAYIISAQFQVRYGEAQMKIVPA